MLLDWAFAVPPGAPTGHLVTPEEMARLRTPPSPSLTRDPAGANGGTAGGASVGGLGSAWGILGALLALAVSVTVFVVMRLVRVVRRRRLLNGHR
jgi:hypothetical protein